MRTASHTSSSHTECLQYQMSTSQPGIQGETAGTQEQEPAPGWTAGKGVCR